MQWANDVTRVQLASGQPADAVAYAAVTVGGVLKEWPHIRNPILSFDAHLFEEQSC